jgi:hypothetical protein
MSAETKWTPGPWTVDGRVVRAPPRDDTEGRAYAVCRVVSLLHPGTTARAKEMHAANACLIAAATALYEELEWLVRWEEEEGSEMDLDAYPARMKAAHAALARARGEEPTP